MTEGPIQDFEATAYIKKKLIHDILPCDDWHRFMGAMGMIPASVDVEDMEHAASHLRLNRTAPINETMRVVAGLAGEVVGRCILENQGMEPDPELIDTYRRVARASVQAVVANLIELNLIHLGGHP